MKKLRLLKLTLIAQNNSLKESRIKSQESRKLQYRVIDFHSMIFNGEATGFAIVV
ncbi:hypothetical protein FHS10_002933 [Mucilaginibacter dorajii]|nr:hypothetical protein [Mucilaginibacter dorajii]